MLVFSIAVPIVIYVIASAMGLAVAPVWPVVGLGVIVMFTGFCLTWSLAAWDLNHPPWIEGGQVRTWMPLHELYHIQWLGLGVMAFGGLLALIGGLLGLRRAD